jgi:hypothetical protein
VNGGKREGRRSGNARFIRIHSVCLRDDQRRQNISGSRIEKQVTASVDARVGERVFMLAETDCDGGPLSVESTAARLGFHYYAVEMQKMKVSGQGLRATA